MSNVKQSMQAVLDDKIILWGDGNSPYRVTIPTANKELRGKYLGVIVGRDENDPSFGEVFGIPGAFFCREFRARRGTGHYETMGELIVDVARWARNSSSYKDKYVKFFFGTKEEIKQEVLSRDYFPETITWLKPQDV